MSRDEERVNGARAADRRERAPPHWLDSLVLRPLISTVEYRLGHGSEPLKLLQCVTPQLWKDALDFPSALDKNLAPIHVQASGRAQEG